MVDHDPYVRVLGKIAQTLITEYGIAEVLYELCDDIVDLLPVHGAGVMLVDSDDELRFAAASDDRVAVIEQLQSEHGEGPCLDAYRRGIEVVTSDLTQDESYPAFAPAAVEAQLQSVHAFPMRVHDRLIGALSLYGDDVVKLDEPEEAAARTLAASATAYILNHRALDEMTELATQLRQALDSRVVIEQAKGRLTEQLGIDPAEAFERLRTYARDHGLRLRAVAQDLVDGKLTLDG